MPIVGDPPSHGVRFRLERAPEAPSDGDAPARGPVQAVYAGEISTALEKFAVRLEVLADGSVNVHTDAGAELAEKARLLVRTTLKHAESEGQPAPRLIQRWRR
jgi:hypothetical protein